MEKNKVIARLEQAIYEYRETIERDERSAVIMSLIEDLEAMASPEPMQ
jgi:hypothetical protein